MRFRPVLLLLIVPLMTGSIFSAQETQPAYRNPKLTVEERAADLLQRMTLEEKVDQLAFARRRAQASNPEEKQIFDELSKLWHEDAQLSPHDAAEIRNKAQHFLVEKTRLGIPALL
jgi:beta-glucosidase